MLPRDCGALPVIKMGAGVSSKNKQKNIDDDVTQKQKQTVTTENSSNNNNNNNNNNNASVTSTITANQDCQDPLENSVRPATHTTTPSTTMPTPPSPPSGVPKNSTTSDNNQGAPSPQNKLAPHFVISIDDLEILEAIGEGGFCRVHKARFVQDRSTVAVKKLKGMNSPSENTLQSFKKEIALHSKIRHPHVIQFFGGCTKPPDLCLVTEFMFCSLQHALDNDPAAFHPQFEVETALCIALGLNHLHCLNVIHRDLKASNVLVDRNYCNPKIADFGLARVKLAIEESMTKGVGSPFAMAPEVFTSSSYTQAVDWYAFGILLWQLVTKKHPYIGMKQMDIVKHVVHEDKRLPLPEEAHPILRDLMARCWVKVPEARPKFQDVMRCLEDVTIILEGSMLGAMAREAVHDAYPSQQGLTTTGGENGEGGEAGVSSRASSTSLGSGGGGGGVNSQVQDATEFEELDFLDQTLTWDDVLELEAKINMQELQLEVVTLRRELEEVRAKQSQKMTDSHHRSMQSKEGIMQEHDAELKRLETSILQERMRQKIKLRKRLKQNKRKSRPDVSYALSLINNPSKAAARVNAANETLSTVQEEAEEKKDPDEELLLGGTEI